MQLFCRWRSYEMRLTCGKLRVIALCSALSSSEPMAIPPSVSIVLVCVLAARKFTYMSGSLKCHGSLWDPRRVAD